ncbi:MAG: histidinol dehydrogenase [Solobacterium sp.]|jgi:histidinol dehydrogenase|nr:histidinol dehydrogenase [Solobacterium sp.]MCH4049655.1 histidinol dehydrogenase [Solobacterium sp.]MCH4073340.1 histidinol dehydrogenase [Solobacterium sp.]MCI1312999.1 histidinol dehydrogenase [Solobacterium sp.]MCI1345568.1 histidinol dehydrogenase [Solobacterium sp.]
MLEEIDAGNPEALRKYLDSRSAEISDDVLMKVSAILRDVRENGDAALRKYTAQFDGVKVEDFRIKDEELQAAADQVSPSFKEAMEKAAANIRSFHEAQKQNSYLIEKDEGVYLGERVLPLSSCGIYVPGGRAQYPSSVLMNAIPAKVAGVKRIVMVTPPSKDGRLNPDIAFAAKLAGVDEVYRIGGAQAIAALAYGTESIPHVDKITGPGNIFVAAAKKLVFGKVAIDMIAGPSEILAVADEKADPAYLAADLLSQAEHDPMASAILLTPSRPLLNAVNAELEKQSAVLPKRQIVEESLKNYGKAIVCRDIHACIAYANAIAPEHLELMVEDPMPYLNEVVNAGSVFLGYYTCESIGDYFGGTNHVLPTGGTARFSSALGVDAFIKKSCYLHYSEEALERDASYIMTMAHQEQLEAHARAAGIRVKKNEKD